MAVNKGSHNYLPKNNKIKIRRIFTIPTSACINYNHDCVQAKFSDCNIKP